MKVKLDFNHPYKELFWCYGFSESDIPEELLDRLYANLKEIHAADKEAGIGAGVNWLLANADAGTRKIILHKMFDSIVKSSHSEDPLGRAATLVNRPDMVESALDIVNNEGYYPDQYNK